MPVVVNLEDPNPILLASNESGMAILHGTVQTNYPGLEVSVYIDAICDGLTTQVSPPSMTIRGVAHEYFEVLVLIPSNIGNGTVFIGELIYSVLYTYPGGAVTGTSSQTIDIKVLRYYNTNETNEDTHKVPDRSASNTLPDKFGAALVLLSVPVVLSVLLFFRRKNGKPSRARTPN